MAESDAEATPALNGDALHPIDADALRAPDDPGHPPRILLLYGSLRPQSFSRRSVEEAGRILRRLGCETRIFDPTGLPLVDGADPSHPKVQELRDLVIWSEGMVWSSPERHGAMTGLMKTQIDWLPLSMQGGIRPTQGKTLALMQVSGGSQSFNAVNQMRILGRWMRMVTIPNQSSIAKAWLEFDGDRLPEGPFYRRVVDVMEELAKFTWLVRGRNDYLVDRYSERMETVEEVHKRVSRKSD
ncbi:arsenical resistance protein ArsH [Tateyamaria sp. SN6-1]|uniref:arsenical resistance protein ArsH n=1 Tax=Tateyamaria sp. SN6-1 TaxID=3092148 RepID=UPI0039F56B3F